MVLGMPIMPLDRVYAAYGCKQAYWRRMGYTYLLRHANRKEKK